MDLSLVATQRETLTHLSAPAYPLSLKPYTLIDKLGISESDISDTQGDGLLKIEILKSEIFKRNDIQTCFEFMIKGIELIDEAYPGYLTLKKVEVQND